MSKIHSRGYFPAPATAEEKQLFFERLPKLIEQTEAIMTDRELFDSLPGSFAYTSWPYIAGDGLLTLGTLLRGWKHGSLTDTCPNCVDTLYVYAFAGSPLSGINSFSAYCLGCRVDLRQRADGKLFIERMKFVLSIRSTDDPC